RADTGEAIPRAEVELSATDQATAEAIGDKRIVRTGADGAFIFADIPAGKYQLEAWSNGFTESSGPRADPAFEGRTGGLTLLLKPGEKLENLRIRLHPAGVLAGQISDEDHDAVPELDVYALLVKFVRGGRRQIIAVGRAVTDDLGNFRIPNLPPGPYYVRAGGLIARPMKQVGLKEGPAGGMQYRNTYYPGTSSLDEAQVLHLTPEGINAIQFAVPTERTFTIAGKVLAKSPRDRAEEVRYVGRDTEGYGFSTTGLGFAQVAPDGSFKTPPLPPGDYTLSADVTREGVQTELGYASVRIVDSDEHADIQIGHAIDVRGRAEAPQAFSLGGTKIALETFGPGFYLLHQGTVDSSARFLIPNVPPGENMFTLLDSDRNPVYVKKAVCNGRDYASTVIMLASGTTLDCNVTLANDTGVIHGKVMNGDNPVAKMVVVLIPESKELRRIPRYTLTSKTHADGEYRISGVIPGDYLLLAVPPSPDNKHFALDFADNHRDSAERIDMNASGVQKVNLKLTSLE
ncbi:MAG TPA: carboxypeptidase-like regulatory domain-containing protein, partial [Terriglobales bacterium]|nr:carboxypeptidase-like regulatory domain-containing protein [Terriglobales bacterium]